MSRRRRGRAPLDGRAAAEPGEVAPPTPWTRRDAISAALGVAFLVVQLAVPTALLFGPRPQRFGWQMFSAAPGTPTLVGRRVDGSRETLSLEPYFAFLRGDIGPSYAELLPGHICRVTPGFVAVELHHTPGVVAAEHAC
jgi:hypothetical protein